MRGNYSPSKILIKEMNVMEWTMEVGCAYDADIAVGKESSGKIAVTIQLKDYAGNNLTVPNSIIAYCASDSDGLTYAVNDLTTDIHTDTGSLAVLVAQGVYQLVSTAAGLIVLDCTDSAACTAFYLVLVLPNGKLIVSDSIEVTGA